MSYRITIGPRDTFSTEHLHEMFRLRARVFRDRLGWEVPIIGGMEVDGYDALNPHYMLITDAQYKLLGSWRLLPTEGPYMLSDTFPELLHGVSAPKNCAIWELSRFAIEIKECRSFGFTGVALAAMREVVTFGDRAGIDYYVTVTTTAMERLLLRIGINVTRLGSPLRIGGDVVVALIIDIGKQTHKALFGSLTHVA